MCGIYSPLSDY